MVTTREILRQYIVPAYYVTLHIISLLLSLYILLQIFLSSTKIFNSSKKRNPISSNSSNQKFVLKTLVFMLCCDMLLALSDISYVIWEFVASYIPAFQPTPEAYANIRSSYWVFLRVLRSIGIVSYTANYASGIWTVCFAISLYLSLDARGKNIRFKLAWEIAFQFFATFVSILVCVYWCLYRNISTETEFFSTNKRADGIFVGTFYLYNLLVYVILFVVDAVVCLLTWRLVSKSISKIRNMSSVLKRRMRASEWKLMMRLSLFLLPFLLVGGANCIWYGYLAWEAFTGNRHDTFEEYFIYYHSTVIPFKGILNAFIYGFNVHRLDKKIVRCLCCCLRRKKRRSAEEEFADDLLESDEDKADYQYMKGDSSLPTPTSGMTGAAPGGNESGELPTIMDDEGNRKGNLKDTLLSDDEDDRSDDDDLVAV